MPPARADYAPLSGYDPGERVRRKIADLVVRKAGLWPGDRALDGACGVALAGAAIARKFTRCRVAAVDARAEAVARARANVALDGGLERFLAVRAEPGALPFRDEWFRFATSTGLSTVEDPIEAIAEIHRVTEFWGKVLLVDVDLTRAAKRPPRGMRKRALDDDLVEAMREMGWGKIQRQKIEVLPGGAMLEALAAKRWDPEGEEPDGEDADGDDE